MIHNFSYIVDGVLAGSAHPGLGGMAPETAEELHRLGIGAVVSLDEYGLADALLAEYGLKYLHIPVNDFDPPTLEQADEFVRFVRASAAEQRPVLAHCFAGMGRTGTMLACYLVAEGQPAGEAVRTVRARRPGSIESRSQEEFIGQYEGHIRRAR